MRTMDKALAVFARVFMWLFGLLGAAALVGSLWNPWQLLFAAFGGAMVWMGRGEVKNEK